MYSSFWPPRAAMRRPGSTWMAFVAGTLAGLLLPVGILVMGWGIELLAAAGWGSIPEKVSVGPFVFTTSWLGAGNSAVRAVSGLLLLLAAVAIAKYFAVTANESAARHASVDFDTQVQKLLFTKSSALATEEGLSVQSSALHEIQTDLLPKVREAILAWYTAWPRYILRLVLLIALAVSIHPWLTASATMGLIILGTLYVLLESANRKRREAHGERLRQSREQLMYLCDTAPLLATIHNSQDTAQQFQSHLQAYRQSSAQLVDDHAWKTPSLRLGSILVAIILAVLVSIRVLDRESSIGLGGAAALCAAVAIAAYSLYQTKIAIARRRDAEVPLQKIVSYLSQGEPVEKHIDALAPARIEKELVFDHVMLRESNGKKLLEDVSVVLRPGQITALVGSERLQTRALAELCLGFGKPTSGRVLIDGVDASDFPRVALQRLALWVAPNGPLLSGSIEENLWITGQPDATIDLMDAARKARVADAIMNLPEGMQTLVSPIEQRLDLDALFRIGIARGFVKKPSIVVAEEPGLSQGSSPTESTEALAQLRNEGFIVVVLPGRLSTLRAADQIVLLHQHRVEDIGTHAELLERNELYRHLNYVRFARLGLG